jgi:hypothetical protein
MARAPVKTFDSGNANRDAHMLEVVEGARFPLVVVRGVLAGFKPQTLSAGPSKVRAQCEVDFHGVKVTQPIDIEVTPVDALHVTATFRFKESLSAHKVERPSLLFIPVDDDLEISGTFRLELLP